MLDIAVELPKLLDRRNRVVEVFRSRGIADLFSQVQQCVQLLAELPIRAEFINALRQFYETLNLLEHRPEVPPDVFRDAKLLGFINKVAANLYGDPMLNLLGIAEKVKALIDKHVSARGVDPKIPPTTITDAAFEQVLANEPNSRARAAQRLLWVHRTLARKEQSRPRQIEPEYVAGETFRYLGKPYPLVLVAEQDKPLLFDGRRFLLHRPRRAMAEQAFRRWYIDAGKAWVPERIERLLPRVGRAPSKIVVRDLGFRWGSCGRTGTINLNWRALQLPTQLIDYLLIHELCHLFEVKHNPAFWQAVERALPDWRNRTQELDAQAALVFWCHQEHGAKTPRHGLRSPKGG